MRYAITLFCMFANSVQVKLSNFILLYLAGLITNESPLVPNTGDLQQDRSQIFSTVRPKTTYSTAPWAIKVSPQDSSASNRLSVALLNRPSGKQATISGRGLKYFIDLDVSF